jgi:hypothetical protein
MAAWDPEGIYTTGHNHMPSHHLPSAQWPGGLFSLRWRAISSTGSKDVLPRRRRLCPVTCCPKGAAMGAAAGRAPATAQYQWQACVYEVHATLQAGTMASVRELRFMAHVPPAAGDALAGSALGRSAAAIDAGGICCTLLAIEACNLWKQLCSCRIELCCNVALPLPLIHHFT